MVSHFGLAVASRVVVRFLLVTHCALQSCLSFRWPFFTYRKTTCTLVQQNSPRYIMRTNFFLTFSLQFVIGKRLQLYTFMFINRSSLSVTGAGG